MTQSSSLDPSRCPVCGAPNSCAMAAASKEPCWCVAVELSEQALARIPEAARDIVCLCPRCASFEATKPVSDGEPTLP